MIWRQGGDFVSFGDGLVVKNTVVYLICDESRNFVKESEPMSIDS